MGCIQFIFARKSEQEQQHNGQDSKIEQQSLQKTLVCKDLTKNTDNLKSQMNEKTNTEQKNNKIIPVQYEDKMTHIQIEQPSQLQSFKLITVGIQNMGNTCYINSALQMVRQIRNNSPNFLKQKKSKFAQLLENFYQNLEYGQHYQKYLSNIISEVKKDQTHERGGGDSYLTALSLLSKITQELYDDQDSQIMIKEISLSNFEKYFSLIIIHGLMCNQCQQYSKEYQFDIDYEVRIENSLEIACIEQLSDISSMNGQQQYRLECQKCQKINSFKVKQTILFYPQILILKFNRVISHKDTKQLNQKIIHIKNKEELITYDLIGYCTYTGIHYTYTGKYEEQWVLFNDSYSSKTQFNLNNTIYLLFKQQN